MSNRLSTVEGLELQQPGAEGKKLENPANTSEERYNNVTVIQIDISDPFVTKTGEDTPKSCFLSSFQPICAQTKNIVCYILIKPVSI